MSKRSCVHHMLACPSMLRVCLISAIHLADGTVSILFSSNASFAFRIASYYLLVAYFYCLTFYTAMAFIHFSDRIHVPFCILLLSNLFHQTSRSFSRMRHLFRFKLLSQIAMVFPFFLHNRPKPFEMLFVYFSTASTFHP